MIKHTITIESTAILLITCNTPSLPTYESSVVHYTDREVCVTWPVMLSVIFSTSTRCYEQHAHLNITGGPWKLLLLPSSQLDDLDNRDRCLRG